MYPPTWWSRAVDAVGAEHEADPDNLPGAVFGAETGVDGRCVDAIGRGWSRSTICDIGSMTKAFTATGILLALEEHGLLDVESPVWTLPGMESYGRHPLTRQIRVRHLLQHTAGLPNVQRHRQSPRTRCNDPESPCPRRGPEPLDLGPTVPWTCFPGGTNEWVYADGRCRQARAVPLGGVSEYVMQTYPPIRQPGLESHYSPLHYVVAARIVEQLTRTSLNVYLKLRLFEPMQMNDSFFVAQPTGDSSTDAWLDEGVTQEQRDRVAKVTLITRDGEMPEEVAPGPEGTWDELRRGWRFVYPDGGMYSTVDDLLSFLAMIRDGGIHDGRCVLSPRVHQLLVADAGHGHTMGFGYRERRTDSGEEVTTYEHLGSKMTYMWLDARPTGSLLGVFLSQRLPNIAVQTNMAVGMKVIFKAFAAHARSAPLGRSRGSVA